MHDTQNPYNIKTQGRNNMTQIDEVLNLFLRQQLC